MSRIGRSSNRHPATNRARPPAPRRGPVRAGARDDPASARRAAPAASGGTNQPYWYWSLMVQSTRSLFHRPAQPKSRPTTSIHGIGRASCPTTRTTSAGADGATGVCVADTGEESEPEPKTRGKRGHRSRDAAQSPFIETTRTGRRQSRCAQAGRGNGDGASISGEPR